MKMAKQPHQLCTRCRCEAGPARPPRCSARAFESTVQLLKAILRFASVAGRVDEATPLVLPPSLRLGFTVCALNVSDRSSQRRDIQGLHEMKIKASHRLRAWSALSFEPRERN